MLEGVDVVEIELDLECGKCGRDLKWTMYRDGRTAIVEPCKWCLAEEYDRGVRDGQKK